MESRYEEMSCRAVATSAAAAKFFSVAQFRRIFNGGGDAGVLEKPDLHPQTEAYLPAIKPDFLHEL